MVTDAIAQQRTALQAGRKLAAKAYGTALNEAARTYIATLRAVRRKVTSEIEVERLEAQRRAFANLLRVELAALATARLSSEAGLVFKTPAASDKSLPAQSERSTRTHPPKSIGQHARAA
ncbi:hypothetical protein CKO32_03095 [Afifella marina DSM 2698]|uniref:Uncharacterized protein n=2 Tax=Afifella marina TaxID=1080 RepID=A0A1G5N654_AFIMA|nr:hypothetical protein [Afifella marina DSM 2698]MBK1626740.1 hypothetical protein [Afifella marina]MBK5919330.1 hypothetical protein [Afifella marina]RAI21363.1 hypothetical protein CH311_07805 [Afifella marina DSM 2698]SCZ32856.1 hypothetical protein SAMN03080610_01593 [Afifella marina DSM 2698]